MGASLRSRNGEEGVRWGEDEAPRFYSNGFLWFVVIYVLSVGTLNLLADPNDTFPVLHLSSLDEKREWEGRVATANSVWRNDIDVAILGSSRPRAAFAGADDLYPGKAFFNAALPNTSLRETESVAQLLFERSDPELLIVGAEFDVFNYDHIVDEYGKSLFSPDQKLLEVYLEQLLSIYAAEKSLEVLGITGEAVETPPYRERFETLLTDAIRLALTIPPPERYPEERYGRFRNILRLAESERTEVVVVLMPVHASLLTVYEELGLWSSFDAWKEDLLATVGRRAKVYDFTGYSDKNSERVPPAKSPNAMRWFTDPSHCSVEYGRWILKVLGDEEKRAAFLLTKQSIDAVERKMLRRQERYLADHPDEFAWVKSLIASYEEEASPQ